uniref:Uncharacterized protein n=1 Tax=Arundo donax TaxID=35708 RepID=A0A0A8ZX94_ARUDO
MQQLLYPKRGKGPQKEELGPKFADPRCNSPTKS